MKVQQQLGARGFDPLSQRDRIGKIVHYHIVARGIYEQSQAEAVAAVLAHDFDGVARLALVSKRAASLLDPGKSRNVAPDQKFRRHRSTNGGQHQQRYRYSLQQLH